MASNPSLQKAAQAWCKPTTEKIIMDVILAEAFAEILDEVKSRGNNCDDEKKKFHEELESLINRHSMENGSDTPDFILARYMATCLEAFDAATKRRDEWYGFKSLSSQVG